MKGSTPRTKGGNGARKKERPDVDPAAMPSKLAELLSLRMPRCSVCGLDWFNDFEEEECEVQLVGEDRNSDELITLKCRNLLPLPSCKCTTSMLHAPSFPLYENHHQPLNNNSEAFTEMAKEIKNHKREGNENSKADAEEIIHFLIQKYCQSGLSDLSLKHYPRKAMCKECIMPFISTSNDVIELDYRSDPQHNPKFSVGGKCTCCRTRFNARALERSKSFMLAYQDIGNGNGNGNSRNNCNHKVEIQEWFQSVKGTIQLVQETKRLKKILSTKIRRNRRVADFRENSHDTKIHYDANDISVATHGEAVVGTNHTANILKWLHDEEEHSSDDCFSDDGEFDGDDDENDSWNGDDTLKPTKKAANIIAPEAGEIRLDLIKKDPKFRQEVEDLAYIREKAKTKEGRVELGIESDEDDDGELLPPSQGNHRKRKYRQSAEDLQSDEHLAKKLQRQERRISTRRGQGREREREPKSPLLQLFKKQINQTNAEAEKSATKGKGKAASLISSASSSVLNYAQKIMKMKKLRRIQRSKDVGILKYVQKEARADEDVSSPTDKNIVVGKHDSPKSSITGDRIPTVTQKHANVIMEPIEILSDTDDDDDISFAKELDSGKQTWLEANENSMSTPMQSQMPNDNVASMSSSSTPTLENSYKERPATDIMKDSISTSNIDTTAIHQSDIHRSHDGDANASSTNHKSLGHSSRNNNKYAGKENDPNKNHTNMRSSRPSPFLLSTRTRTCTRTVDESELSTMMAMGFNREECIQAMMEAEHNVDLAINLILNHKH